MKVGSILALGLTLTFLSGCGIQAAPELATLKDQEVRLETGLKASSAYAGAKGKAKFRDRTKEQEFQVEVENVKALTGKTLDIFVSGVNVGDATVNTFGKAKLVLNSKQGQVVPKAVKGTPVEVKSADALVVFGKF